MGFRPEGLPSPSRTRVPLQDLRVVHHRLDEAEELRVRVGDLRRDEVDGALEVGPDRVEQLQVGDADRLPGEERPRVELALDVGAPLLQVAGSELLTGLLLFPSRP